PGPLRKFTFAEAVIVKPPGKPEALTAGCVIFGAGAARVNAESTSFTNRPLIWLRLIFTVPEEIQPTTPPEEIIRTQLPFSLRPSIATAVPARRTVIWSKVVSGPLRTTAL